MELEFSDYIFNAIFPHIWCLQSKKFSSKITAITFNRKLQP